MAQTAEGGATEEVEKIRFSFMTNEEVKRHSVVKIINPTLLDGLGRPTPAGLYDPAMGPFDEISSCKSCGQGSYNCPGHCGHMELVSPVYNPLLFNGLYNLLQRVCFFCFHFRAKREEVDRCVTRLKLIAKGDVIGSRNLDSTTSEDSDEPKDSEGSHVSHGSRSPGVQNHLEHIEQCSLDSFRFTEAKSVINKFLSPRTAKCPNCEVKNPKITKPNFGWFESNLSGVEIRGNIIRSRGSDGFPGGSEERYSSELLNANESALENDAETGESDSFTIFSGGKGTSKVSRPSYQASVSQKFEKQKNSFCGHLLPTEVIDVLKRLWEAEASLCSFICDLMSEDLNTPKGTGPLMFFLDSVLVPPTKFRPPARGGDSVMEHPHTVLLGKVLQSNISLGNAHTNDAGDDKIVERWKDLQQSINVLYNSKTAVGQSQMSAEGICQFLEKKSGIFRQKMMGKRVNFAGRSVISPDPYLGVNEIGIPPYFALKLTYPEKVTGLNVDKLRKAIINGPDIHPGALSYADKVTIKLKQTRKARVAISRKLPSSRGVGTQIGKSSEYEFEGKVVHRHLQDGDIVLVNRQPTLHKPGIMAHIVRVLPGEKTIRMHYANCSSYNADFDGDEMNIHFPQDEISRAEAYNIVNANEQYIVPTKGDTVRGLIQDHIVSAVLLTLKDTFLTKDEFTHLLYGSVVCATGSLSRNHSWNISDLGSEGISLPMPALWKPCLWTGKQVITALLNHLTKGCVPCTVEKEMKIPKEYFTSETSKHQPNKNEKKKELSTSKTSGTSEHQPNGNEKKNKLSTSNTFVQQPNKNEKKNVKKDVDDCFLVFKNELLCGVFDKAQFGQFGLVHTVQELYGSNTAGLLLSALSRLFTIFLQIHGFTCGVEDLIILPRFDDKRKAELEDEDVGKGVHCDLFNWKADRTDSLKLQSEVEKLLSHDRESTTALLDMKMKNALNTKASKISKNLLRQELLKPFPKNCISLMTISGAKGATVNFQQISSYLGQQELEGKRVPRMISGKTLPCFPPWDVTSRAGGFITDRFLSGLRPQEYYFHCMAGREGLVDTAVKTSRSGYLQRCLIKNLESLKVCYDYTVRDADGSIIQFFYGEDGVDVHKTSFLKNLKALALNEKMLHDKYKVEHDFNSYIVELPEELEMKTKSVLEESEATKLLKELESLKQLELPEEWENYKKSFLLEFTESSDDKIEYDLFLNVVKERRKSLLEAVKEKAKSFLEEGKAKEVPKQLEENAKSFLGLVKTEKLPPKRWVLPKMLGEKAKSVLEALKTEDQRRFLKLLTQKYLSSLAPAGEPVGVIAAQSIGEPSTQLTLNTFHLAGRGEMNVTLGVPRLQEILKTAAVFIKTPVITCPFLQFKSKDGADSLVKKVVKITVADVIESMEVHILPLDVYNNEISRIYKLMMTIKHHDIAFLEETLTHSFLRGLEDAIQNHIALLSKINGIKNFKSNSRPQENEMDEDVSLTSHGKETDVDEDGDDGDDLNDDIADDLGSDAQKRKQQVTDEVEYEDTSGDESADENEEGMAGESHDEHGTEEDKETVNDEYEDASEVPNDKKELPKHNSSEKKVKAASEKNKSRKIFAGKETDRHVFVEFKGKKFEAHFRFTDEPHILLAQIAQRTAKNVYIKGSGKISQCKLVEHDVSENSVIWDGEKAKAKKKQDAAKDEEVKVGKKQEDGKAESMQEIVPETEALSSYWALKAAGVDFGALWEMQNDLDVTRLYSNSVHAMLTTYGVEAARATIIREVKNVFGIYGIQVDNRHLSLIADYMTHTGGYRPMSRHGCITDTLSPLSKMSFETASKFLVEAASFGLSDDLETPSSRICLGLPVKMGTGCFDLMQQFEI